MPRQLTADDARQSLNAHVVDKGAQLRAKYGSPIGFQTLQRILEDRAFVRYPCELVFSAEALQPGEFAHPLPRNPQSPEDGFTIYVHPHYLTQLAHVPHLVLYQLVLVNYGEFASPDDAETFGAHSLGLAQDDYYATLCELADQVSGCPSHVPPP